MQRVTAIVDLQFGSTGKGLLAGYLAVRGVFTAVVTAWAPNAGHTFVDRFGRKFVHTQLANAVVSPRVRDVFIGPGSVIDPDKLLTEMGSCSDLLVGKTLYIHAAAAVVQQRHRDAEAELLRIGSTQKGASAAVAERSRRDPGLVVTAGDGGLPPTLRSCVVSPRQYIDLLTLHDELLVEGHQGFGLSLYHGMWPYVTARDTTTHAILADCGVPRPRSLTVWGTLRTFPIRVANRYGADGAMVGTSGPGYDDQQEITWGDLRQAPELTTVTQRVRRVFTYSALQVMQAARVNGVDRVFANFLNYLEPERREPFLQKVAGHCTVDRAAVIGGYGPSESDVDVEEAVYD